MSWGTPKTDRKNTETNSGWPKETKDKSGGRFKERYDLFFQFFPLFSKIYAFLQYFLYHGQS